MPCFQTGLSRGKQSFFGGGEKPTNPRNLLCKCVSEDKFDYLRLSLLLLDLILLFNLEMCVRDLFNNLSGEGKKQDLMVLLAGLCTLQLKVMWETPFVRLLGAGCSPLYSVTDMLWLQRLSLFQVCNPEITFRLYI